MLPCLIFIDLNETFKKRVNEFLDKAKEECKEQEENFTKCKNKFKKLIVNFCLKPKPGDLEVTSEYFFNLWALFGHDFKDAWKRECQKLIKQK